MLMISIKYVFNSISFSHISRLENLEADKLAEQPLCFPLVCDSPLGG